MALHLAAKVLTSNCQAPFWEDLPGKQEGLKTISNLRIDVHVLVLDSFTPNSPCCTPCDLWATLDNHASCVTSVFIIAKEDWCASCRPQKSPRGTDVYLSNTSKPEGFQWILLLHPVPIVTTTPCCLNLSVTSRSRNGALRLEQLTPGRGNLSYAPHTQLYGFQPCFRPRCVDPRWAAPWTGHLATQAQSWNILGGLSTHDELRDREKHVIISNRNRSLKWYCDFQVSNDIWPHSKESLTFPVSIRFFSCFPHFHRISPGCNKKHSEPIGSVAIPSRAAARDLGECPSER